MTTPDATAPAPPAEGELVAVEHEGVLVAVTRLEGTLHALADTCPHAGCSLSEGDLDGRTLVCPCHQAAFDVTTGAVQGGPARTGVATWSVREDGGALVLGDPEGAAGADPATAGAPAVDLDIAVLVQREHDAMREQFAAVEELTGTEELTEAWATLSQLLEVHARGEEVVLYPELARAAVAEGTAEAVHAVRDHNGIRDGVRAVDRHAVGGEPWWQALRAAREVNEEHLQEEERAVLPLFRDSTGRDAREELGRAWVAFHEEHQHARGLTGADADPAAVVAGG